MFSQYSNNLIISTDDFGVSKLANERILRLAREKKIDRVAVMAGGAYSQEEAKELAATGVKLDIHLYLLPEDYFKKRQGEKSDNVFKRVFVFLIDLMSGRYSAGKVRLVWQKQIEDFKEAFGRYPDGLNSHEHLHFFPSLFRSILRLKDKYSIAYLRLGKDRLPLGFNMIAFILNTLRRIDIRLNKLAFPPTDDARVFAGETNTSDYLVSFDWITDADKFFESLPEIGQTELVFHPEREAEFDFLMKNF